MGKARVRVKALPLNGAVLRVMLLLVAVPGCTLQPPAIAPQATAKVEDAQPAAVEVPLNETAVPTQAPVDDSPIVARDEPLQASEPMAAAGDALEPQTSAAYQEELAADAGGGPQARTVFYRADANQAAAIPTVRFSKGHEALCHVKVGDTMPAMELEQLDGGRVSLPNLAGRTATVVIFWKSDRRMSHQLLADLGPDVIQPFGGAGVAVVGIAVGESAEIAAVALRSAGAKFPNLIDGDGKAFAQIGSEKLPRTYLLNPQGKILWFDIEYSLATRRELHQALRAVTAERSE